tara:strand:+ start:2035 stop:5043 length:3009 start_codon:yes stop_codon:yes gene_type:complete
MKAGQIKIYLLLTTLFLTSGSIPLFSQNNRFQDLKGRRIAKAPEGEKALLRRGGFLLAQADPKAGDNQEKAGDQAPAAQEKAPVEPAPAAPKAPAAPQAEEKPADEKAAEKPQAAEEKAPAKPADTTAKKDPATPAIEPEKETPADGKAPEAKAGAITIEASNENEHEFTPNAKYLNQRVDIHEGQIPLDDFLRFLADFTGLTVILSGGPAGASARQGQMVNITAPIYLADFEIVKAILDANGFQLVRRKLSTGKEIITISSTATSQSQGGVKETPVIKVGASGATQMDSQLKKGDLGLSSDELATMVFQLDHVAPADAILSLNTLATGTQSKGSTRNSGFNVAEVKGTQTIIVTAKFGLLDYIVKLLKIIDVEQKNPDRIVHIIEAREADAQELVSIIESFLQQNRAGRTPSRTTTRPTTSSSSASRSSSSLLRGGATEFETSLIADPRTQKIIITTYTMADLEDINMLVRELDTRFDLRRLKTQIYRMRYLKAIDVAPVISDILGSSSGSRSGTRGLGTSARSRTRTPGRATTTTSRGSLGGTTGRTSGISGNSAGGGMLPTMIVPHEETNSLIIQSEPEDYAEIIHILEQIDVKRRQVFLEAALVQVSQQSGLNYTIELLAGDPDDRSARILFEQSFGLSGINNEDFNRIFDLTTPPAGGVVALMNRGKFPLLVQFLKTHSDSKVLATPFILADDNVQSTINITETRYVVNTATVNTSTTTSQQGEEAGITLDIFPTINSENSVFLEAGLEVSEFSQIETNNVLPPKTTNSITSSVTIAGDRIYVIGGLTRETRSKVVEKVPLLGDIPFLGKLFRTEGGAVSVTNLYIFLRAHILTDENFTDLANLTDQALEKAATSSEGDPITSQFELPPKPPKADVKIDRDAPDVFRRSNSDDSNDKELRKRVEDAQENYRGTHKEDNTGRGNETTALPPIPPRGANRENGSPFEKPPSPKIPRPEPVASGAIPAAWKKRGLRVNPAGNSWFIPLRLDLRGAAKRDN